MSCGANCSAYHPLSLQSIGTKIALHSCDYTKIPSTAGNLKENSLPISDQ